MITAKNATRKSHLVRFGNFLIALVLMFSIMNVPGAGIVHAQDWTLPDLEPVLSADGLTMYNGVTPLVVMVDPDPAHQGIQMTRDPEIQAAIEAADADPDFTAAAFVITYKAAGTQDPWAATCVAFPAAAQTAFNAAAAIWTATLQSSVPIRISACWSALGSPNILGYSGGQPMHRDFTGAPVANTWYQDSLGNSLHGSDQDATAVDMHITYNSAFTWYLGTNGVVPAGQYDLVTVAAHEIAHGLNFSGTAGYSGGLGSWGRGTGYPNIYDRFMESSGGTKVPAYANNSAALGSLYTSGSLWFDGTNANAANGATRVRMYAPGTWSGGSSYSHLDEIFNGTSNDMMTFSVPSGYSQHNPGNVTKGLLKDLGWVLASTTPVTIPTPTAPSGTISDRTPTFKWTKISGATQYRFDVYAGSTLVYSKTVTSTSACPSSTCSNTPTTSLAYAAHKWRVRAYVSGAWKTFSAYKTFTVTNIPTPQTPTGSITDTTPTFKWTRIDGATQYYLVVYNGTSTVAYTKTVTNANCGASTTTCSNTPTNVLTTGAHNWKVRAYVGGAWKAYSALKSFSVATSTAFNDHFTSSSAGWTPLNGSWSVASSYYQTPGIASMWTSAKHSNTYSTFTYEVTLSRTDNASLSYGIYFNASPTPLASTGGWNNGYAFYILDDGYYSVWRRAGGVATNLWPWTVSEGISSGTNTLKVTYNPTTRFVQFYINGTRMLTGTFNTYTSGTVGLVYYRDTTASKLYVDIAKLSLTAPSAMTAGDGIYIDEAAIDMSIAENSETGGYTGVEWMAPEPR